LGETATEEQIMTETTRITAETTIDEISAYLTDRDIDIEHTTEGAIKFERAGRRVCLYQHPESDGADIAGLWAYNVVGDCSDGLDSMQDIAWLIS
jgi:hypothetical protein